MAQESDRSHDLHGIEMDDEEIDAYLRDRGTGVLALAVEGDSYAVPVSFGYDGDRLYFFLLRFGDESRKLDFAESTRTTSFVTYDFDDAHHWRSVVARGRLVKTPDEDAEAVEAVMNDNAEFANLFPFGEPMTEQVRYQLEVEELTGQKGHGHDT